MASINVSSTRLNQVVHRARIDAEALLALANSAVAERLQLDMAALAGSGRLVLKSRTSSYQEGSLGTSRPCVEVEIVVHYPEDEIEAPRLA